MGRGLLALAGLCVIGAVGCGMGDEPKRQTTSLPAPAPSGSVMVDARQPLLPTFPCSRCHQDRTPDPRERKLTQFHTQKVLDHGTLGGWCYRCHTKDDIDHLHLSDGTLVSFNEAYELCGSCHGDKLRDWKAGIHGLTTGYWLGERNRRSCPACHDPHSPHFPLMTPEHAPALPRTVSPSDVVNEHPEAEHGE
jgi:formate-dependent nitrite reductase cytochrome c552 subunit